MSLKYYENYMNSNENFYKKKTKQKQINLNLFNIVSLFYFGSVSLKLQLEYNQYYLKICRNSMEMINTTPIYYDYWYNLNTFCSLCYTSLPKMIFNLK